MREWPTLFGDTHRALMSPACEWLRAGWIAVRRCEAAAFVPTRAARHSLCYEPRSSKMEHGMAEDSFDFAFVDKTWTWSHRVGNQVVETSTRSFSNLNDCIGDARGAGFHAGAHIRRSSAAVAMLPGDASACAER
jgi:hypothetical protein